MPTSGAMMMLAPAADDMMKPRALHKDTECEEHQREGRRGSRQRRRRNPAPSLFLARDFSSLGRHDDEVDRGVEEEQAKPVAVHGKQLQLGERPLLGRRCLQERTLVIRALLHYQRPLTFFPHPPVSVYVPLAPSVLRALCQEASFRAGVHRAQDEQVRRELGHCGVGVGGTRPDNQIYGFPANQFSPSAGTTQKIDEGQLSEDIGEWPENQILIPDWTYFHCPSATP